MRTNPELHYLDNAATTLVDPLVAQAIQQAMTEVWANPSSLYAPAVQAQQVLERARARVANSLHCAPQEVYFTACGSESNNLALQGAARPRRHWGDKIVVTAFEHPSVQRPLRMLREEGFEVVEIAPEPDGTLDLQKFLAAVDKRTVLAACMAVNNETGARQDVAALAAAVKQKNDRTHVHVDAVQAWLRVPIDLQKWAGVDSLSVSGHKAHVPKGIGALFVRERQRQTLRPPVLGGHQERGLRPGTENLPYAAGMGVAAVQGVQGMAAHSRTVQALRARLLAGLAELPGMVLHTPPGGVAEVVNFSTMCVNSQTMIGYLSDRGVYVSGGSACDKGEHSHTLLAMGCPDAEVRTALRVSLCGDNDEGDIDALLAGLRDGLRELQHI